jgi:hypothetical protein
MGTATKYQDKFQRRMQITGEFPRVHGMRLTFASFQPVLEEDKHITFGSEEWGGKLHSRGIPGRVGATT